MNRFKRILIANRGEIARRIGQTCREMGIQTVCLFTEEERTLPHALEGDIGVSLGQGPLSETYLNIPKLVKIAQDHQADAVHPGYGFLSEKADFAQALKKAGVVFIGPPVAAIKNMGDKVASKVMMEKIGVPTIPGYHGADQEVDFLLKEAIKMGFPVLIKAAAGGGGKGMRVVSCRKDFSSALESAKREAMKAFGDDKVLVEKLITNPRHIEIQLMSDSRGNHFHLFERECSIQRRYQKIVEESPSPAIDEKKRQQMAKTALKIAEHMNYVGAGTIEFILDEEGSYYFLEMNTRLQVEHPVTEMVTGLDLVRLQILAAQGEKFDFTQNELHQRGHAIEVRLYAEDPDNQFLPSIGRIHHVGALSLREARLDTGYRDGNDVTISFDPMLAKLIVHAPNRESAIYKMKQALREISFFGVKTNRDYLNRILSHPAFLSGETYTHFVETHRSDLSAPKLEHSDKAIGLAAYLMAKKGSHNNREEVSGTESAGAWERLSGFRNV